MQKAIQTNNGLKGGLLKGKAHYDSNGNPLGGIKAVVTDQGGKPIEVEGNEVIINKKTVQSERVLTVKGTPKEILSTLNQMDGNGVAIGDEEAEILAKYRTGGKIGEPQNKEIERLKNLPYSKFLLEVLDSYKELNAEVGVKGYNQNSGEPIIGYFPNQYEYMYKSDSTGKPIRFFIDLGNEKYIHPFDINPKFNPTEQKRIEQKADYFVKEGNENYEKSIKELKENNELDIVIETLKKALKTFNIENQYDSSDIFKSSGNSILESKDENKRRMKFDVYYFRVNDSELKSNIKNLDLERFKDEYLAKYKTGGKIPIDINKLSLNEFEKYLEEKYNSKVELGDYKKYIYLSRIEIDKETRGLGIGSEIMSEIINYADYNDKKITLTPSTDYGASSVARLKDFYKNFGFVENKGRNKDFEISQSMYRVPDSDEYKTGGELITYKNKYNKKYGYSNNESHDLEEISEDTGVSIKGLQEIYNKGIGAYKTNPKSVRPNVKSKEQWAMARVYSAVMGGKASIVDKKELDIRFKTGGSIKPNLSKMTPSELKEFYASPEGKKLDAQTYSEWKRLVNMTKSELEKFYNSVEGKKAGLTTSQAKEQGIDSGRESARWIMKMKDIPYKQWSSDMWRWAKKQINFIKRMSGMKGRLYDDKGKKTRKHTALLIWGHNPEQKFDGGGDIKGYDNFKNPILINGFISNKEIDGKEIFLITYNSGGQEGLNVHQTMNPLAMLDAVEKKTGLHTNTLQVFIYEHTENSNRIETEDELEFLKDNYTVIIVDRDSVEFYNGLKRFKGGGELSKKALAVETNDLTDFVRKYFIKDGRIDVADAMQELFGNRRGKSIADEYRKRIGLHKKGGLTISQLAHNLWEQHKDEVREGIDDSDFRNAVEEVLISEYGVSSMIKSLMEKSEGGEQDKESEYWMSQFDEGDDEYYENLSDEEVADYFKDMEGFESELAKGTQHEMEHLDTLKKVAEGKLTPEQAVVETASKHISENPNYYEDLAKMEAEHKEESIPDLIEGLKVLADSLEGAEKKEIEDVIEGLEILLESDNKFEKGGELNNNSMFFEMSKADQDEEKRIMENQFGKNI